MNAGEVFTGFDMGGKDISSYVTAQRTAAGIRILDCGTLQERIIRSQKRRRTLQRRGEQVYWSAPHHAHIWYRRVSSSRTEKQV